MDPDVLGSHCLPFYLTYTTREVPGWRWSGQRGAPCRAKLGTRKWRVPPTLLQRPGLCPWRSIYFMIHKWKGSGVDEPVCLWRVLVVSICVQGGKKERCWSPLRGVRKEQTRENPNASSTEGSHSGENHWHQNHQRGTKMLSLFLLFSPSLAEETVRTARCPCHLLSAFEQVMSSLWTSIFLSVKWRSWPAVQVFKNVPWDPREPAGEDQGEDGHTHQQASVLSGKRSSAGRNKPGNHSSGWFLRCFPVFGYFFSSQALPTNSVDSDLGLNSRFWQSFPWGFRT